MSESRVAKIEKNIAASISQNIINTFIAFISRIIFVRVLSESYLGINGLFTEILAVLSLADLGMETAMMYSLYKPIAENDKEKIVSLISFFRKIYLMIAVAVLVVGIVLIPFLKYIVKLEQPIPHLNAYYILALLNVVVSYLFVYRRVLLSADQKNYILVKCDMVFKVISFVFQIIVLLLFKNYFIYLSVALVVGFVSNIYQNSIAVKKYPYLKAEAVTLKQEERKKIFNDVKALFIYKVSGVIQSNTDNILISVMVGTVYVGYYSNYTMLVARITGIVTLIYNAVKSGLGNYIADANSSSEDRFFIFQVMEMVNFWLVSFCSVCFIVLFQDFIKISFGERYVMELSIVIAAVLNFYTGNIRQTIWAFRETTGIFQETKYITFITAVLNLVLSFVFGIYWGIFGILFATFLSRTIYAWWKEPIVLFSSVFQRSAKIYFIVFIKRFLLCTIISALTYIICNWIPAGNLYIKFFIQIGICCILPNLLLFLIYHQTKEFQYIKGQLLKNVGWMRAV